MYGLRLFWFPGSDRVSIEYGVATVVGVLRGVYGPTMSGAQVFEVGVVDSSNPSFHFFLFLRTSKKEVSFLDS